tara:strand:- start:10423 stop:11295 length:873 start_codon:yes stop_codon:yes gene_type:complete
MDTRQYRFKKGNVPWNKGKKGLQVAWNKGLTKSDPRVLKYSKKISRTRKGMKLSFEQKQKISKSLKGRKPWNEGVPTSEKTKENIRIATTGNKNHFYGKQHSIFSLNRISQARKGKCKGINNPKCKIDLNLYKKEIINSYLLGKSSRIISRNYGVTNMTILNYLKKWKFPIRKSVYGTGLVICKDGHKVLSYPEKRIDDLLSSHGIEHKINERIKDTRYRYDFYIPELNLYIEYWGIEISESYKARKSKKLEIYKKFRLNLLSIYPQEDILKKLGPIVAKCSKYQKILTN